MDDLPRLLEEGEPTKADLDGWLRATTAALIPGVVRGDRAEVNARREELAREWARAKRREHERGSVAVAALLAYQDAVLAALSAAQAVQLPKDSVAARLVEAVAEHPGLAQTELAERLCVPAETVSREGARLEDHGLVVRRRVGRQRLWELTPRGRAAADRLAGPRLVPGEAGSQADERAAQEERLQRLVDEEESRGLDPLPGKSRPLSAAAFFSSHIGGAA